MKKDFGFFGDRKVSLYTIKCGDASCEITDFGATIVTLSPFQKNIIGGYDTVEDYIRDTDSHQGATIGRVANRIADARFEIDGKEFRVTKNNNGNCLHGGCGFDRHLWQVISHSESSITLSYFSHDGEEGFPADLKVTVTFTLSNTSLIIDYKAIPSAKTPISLTNHSYFNLNGLGDDIKSHKIQIFADSYTEVDSTLIPTGAHPSVENTPFDLREAREIGEFFGNDFTGYDHNFIISSDTYETFIGKKLALAAIAYGDNIKMSVYTDKPGIQFYTSNFLGGKPDFAGGIPKIKHGAFCLETQTEPNSVNLGCDIYSGGELYTHTTVYKFEKI